MNRRTLLVLLERIRNVGAVVFALSVGLLLELYVIPPSCRPAEEEAWAPAPATRAPTPTPRPTPTPEDALFHEQILRTRDRLEHLEEKLLAGTISPLAFRDAQYTALLDLADVALRTPAETLEADLDWAAYLFVRTLASTRDVMPEGDPRFREPIASALAWAEIRDRARYHAATLEQDFLPATLVSYFEDMITIAEQGYFAVPVTLAEELGYPDFPSLLTAATHNPSLASTIVERMDEARILSPIADARLVLWDIEDEPLTPEATLILQDLRDIRGIP